MQYEFKSIIYFQNMPGFNEYFEEVEGLEKKISYVHKISVTTFFTIFFAEDDAILAIPKHKQERKIIHQA